MAKEKYIAVLVYGGLAIACVTCKQSHNTADTTPRARIGFCFDTDKPSQDYHTTELQTPTIDNTDAGVTKYHIDYDTTGIEYNDLKLYLDYMYSNQKNNVSPGYISIAKNTGICVENCRKIKGYLERTGTVKTVGAKTIILKNSDLFYHQEPLTLS